MTEEKKNNKSGALWKKEGKLSGEVEIEGKKYWINVFKNDYKTTDKHPDFNILITPKEV